MKKLFLLFLLLPAIAMAEKPATFDHECARNLKTSAVKAANGNYWFSVTESSDKCQLHGVYYQVVVKQWSPISGSEAAWRYDFIDHGKATAFLAKKQGYISHVRPDLRLSVTMAEISY